MKLLLSALVLASMPALVLAPGGTAAAVAPAAGVMNAAAPAAPALATGVTTDAAPAAAPAVAPGMETAVVPEARPTATVVMAAGAPAATAPAVDAGVHAGPDPAELIGPPDGAPLAGAALEARTHDVAATIRCPVCQGVSVADSPSEMAQNMKRQTAELLARGYDAEQIIHYFELSYGEFIRLEPKREGLKSFVWIAPVLLLLVGLGVIARFVWKNLQGAADATPELPKRGAKKNGRFSREARARKSPRPPAETVYGQALPARDRLPDDPALVPWVRKVRELAYGWPDGVPPKGGA